MENRSGESETENELLYLDDSCMHTVNSVSQTSKFNVSSHGVLSGGTMPSSPAKSSSTGFFVCRFTLHSPHDTVLSLVLRCRCRGDYCHLVGVEIEDRTPTVCSQHERGTLVVTKANHISALLRLQVRNLRAVTFSVSVEFQVISQLERGHLPTHYTSTMDGFVTSFGFQLGLLYPDDVSSWWRAVMPPNHGLMVSVPKLNLASFPIDCLDVFITDLRGRLTHVQHECGMNIAPAQVYSSVKLVTVNMTSGRNFQGTGFKLVFSFHELDRLPQKLPSGLFNCSLDVYFSFRQHLHCNLDYECDKSEDETEDCPYSSDRCRGQLASGNKCLFVVGMDRLRHNTSSWFKHLPSSFDSANPTAKRDYLHSAYKGVSWNKAARECQEGNGRLAAFTTEQQWQDMLKIWAYSKLSTTLFFIGFKVKWKKELFMYRNVLKLFDGTPVYFMNQDIYFEDSNIYCVMGEVSLGNQNVIVQKTGCNNERRGSLVLCERTPSVQEPYLNSSGFHEAHQSTIFQNAWFFHRLTWNVTIAVDRLCNIQSHYTLIVCPCGHVTHSFLLCDLHSYCGDERYLDECPMLSPTHCQSRLRQWYAQYEQHTSAIRDSAQTNTSRDQSHPLYFCTDYTGNDTDPEMSISVAMFVCANQDTVHYSLVCDFRPDCLDETDETFCIHSPCDGFFRCSNGQCIANGNRCDLRVQCLDESDEDNCYTYRLHTSLQIPRQPPKLIDFEGTGYFNVSDWSDSQPCPDTHYRCTSQPCYCLPVYTRCNEYYDCAGREDELECDDFRCPGLYRCRGSRVCVHIQHLCDGWPQCPQHDDEWRCQTKPCPETCQCQGLAFVCRGSFLPSDHPDLRYLVMDSMPGKLLMFSHNKYLIYLSLVRCQVSTLPVGVSFPNLQILDVRYNNITILNMTFFEKLPNAKILRFSHNPLLDLINGENGTILRALQVVDLSNTLIHTFSTENLSFYSQVKQFNLSHSKVVAIDDTGFQFCRALEVLDIRGCALERFQLDMFRDLQRLSVVFSPNYRLCCDGVLPGHENKPACFAPADLLSSCVCTKRFCLSLALWQQPATLFVSFLAMLGTKSPVSEAVS